MEGKVVTQLFRYSIYLFNLISLNLPNVNMDIKKTASEMSHDTSWDIEALRSPHEPQHQWELRRSFMEKHKSDFPKDRLVCLAQTLANMEFMGCRYPQDTMDQVGIG